MRRPSPRTGALMALVAAVIAVVGVSAWFDVRPVLESEQVHVIDVDDSAEVAGQRLEMRSVELNEFDAPKGSHTVSVRVHSSGGTAAESCGTLLLAEADGIRVWQTSTDGLDVPYDAGSPGCSAESAPYDILGVFLVPDDASGPFWFEVTDTDGTLIRFPVNP